MQGLRVGRGEYGVRAVGAGRVDSRDLRRVDWE